MEYRIDACETVPQAVLRMPREVRPDRLGEDIAAGMRELTATVRRAGLTACGAPTLTFRDETAPDETAIVDFGVPVEPAPTLGPRSGAEVLVSPGATVARTCHRGGYGSLADAYRALQEWMDAAGYHPVGPATEVYLVGPDEVSDPRRLITEIRIPIAPSPVIAVRVDAPFPDVLERTRKSLRQQGFRILTETDVQGVLRDELSESIEEYRVLVVCSPSLTRRAVRAGSRAGLLLSCSVVVRAVDGAALVEATDPAVLTRAADRGDLRPLADDTRRLLATALDALRAPAHPELVAE
ncbi:DUF302 domain-containing protein [Nocardia wallacei]|nr:GyrI-like domain-containing protein [Nocardia wallacei]